MSSFPKVHMNGLKTILGIGISITPLVASLIGFDTAPKFTGDATEIAGAIVTLAGALFALYGRLVATVPGWFAKRS